MPASFQGKGMEILSNPSPGYTALGKAVLPEGKGGVTSGTLIQLQADTPVYRLWSGPDVKNAQGYTNMLGGWWSFDAPTGTRDAYRTDYEICKDWNELTWVVQCTVPAGTLVVVGPGNSVAKGECADPEESYPANAEDWQVYIPDAYKIVTCPAGPTPGTYYQNDPADISKPLPPPTPEKKGKKKK